MKKESTTYPHIVMNLKKDFPLDPIKIKCSPEERQELDLEEEYNEEFFQVVASLFRKIAKISIFIPGNFKK